MKKCAILLFMIICMYIIGIPNNIHALDLEIKDAKIASEKEAIEIAKQSYRDKLKEVFLSATGSFRVSIIELGYAVPDFSSKGDKIWEVRYEELFNNILYAIIWVNSRTGDVYFVVGPWVGQEK